MCRSIDVRDILPAIRVPTLVMQRTDDRITPPFHGRYLAGHIAGARYFEQPGDHLLWLGDTDAMVAEIELFLTEAGGPGEPDRLLTTVLCVDAPGSAAAGAGACTAAMTWHIRSSRGQVISSTGARIFARFDGPGRAIRCAAACRDAAADLGMQARAGIHTGEVEVLGQQVTGVCVGMAGHLAAMARPAEILVTGTVADLVLGSGIAFAGRGSHRIGDAPGSWRLFAVAGL